MKIVEAPWEKRNLGVTSVNFEIEKTDTVDSLTDEILNNKNYEYQTVKLPVNMMDIHDKLNEAGFKFVEGKFELTCNLKKWEPPSKIMPIFKSMEYHHVTDCDELEEMYNKIKEGLFDTDKIAIDPKFGIEKSAMRYYYWAKDEIDKGIGYPYVASCNGVPIGFSTLVKHDDKTSISQLAALYNHQYIGLGVSVILLNMYESKRLGFKKIITEVSSNNFNSLKVHLSLGYDIKNMYYTMSKHI